MKVSIWFVLLAGYISLNLGMIIQAVGIKQPSYTLDIGAPFLLFGLLIIPAWFGYEAGKEEKDDKEL